MTRPINSSVHAVLLALALVLYFSSATAAGVLYPQFYDFSCPQAHDIIKSVVSKAVAKDARMAASLLRLHFHDCFVKVHICLRVSYGLVNFKKILLVRIIND